MADSYITRLIDTFEARSEHVAMRIVGDEGQVYTFGKSLAAIRSIAYRLGEEKIRQGDRVALIGDNHPCWALAYLGTLFCGAVCVPLDPHGEIETLTNFLENSKAKLAFIAADIKDKFNEIQERLGRHIPAVAWSNGSEPGAIATGSSPPGDPIPITPGSDFAKWAATECPPGFAANWLEIDPKDNALLIYTSGTTGKPKGVPLTHGNIMAELAGIDEVLKLTDKERILSLLPLFHAYLQIVNLWVASTIGCEVGYLKELSPAELGSAMKEFKPTILTTVPRLWYLFHKKIFDAVEAKPKMVQRVFRTMLAANGAARDTFGVNLGRKFFGQVHESFGGSLRIAISAGSRFDEDVALDFHRLGFTILQGYGLTETSGAATATFEDDNRIGSVGKPMRGTEIKISKPDKDGVGEVLIRGGVVFNGYYQNESATAEAFTEDGWFRSGDLGRIDKDGHLYIVGRAKDVIVLPSGKNVHPEDLELHYLKTPLVAELAVVGIKDESERRAGAERLAAVVVPDFEYLKLSNISNSKEAIRYALDDLGRELPEYQRVRDYIIRVEPLPRTATRKIKRFELKKAIEAGTIAGTANEKGTWELSPGDTALLGSNIGKAVISAVRHHASDLETVHPDMNLEIDLGLDSLARAETFAALENAFETEFEGDEAARALTVRDAVALIEKHIGEAGALEPVSTDLNWARIVKETDEEIPEIKVVLRNRPFFLLFAFTVYKIFNLVCRVFLRLEVTGTEQFLEMKRPFIVCPNHQSFLDPFVVCSTYSFDFFRNTFHVGASEFFAGRLMSFVAQMLHVVPVDPDTQLMKAMKAGAIGLKRGKVLNIYPEGERAYDGELHEFKKGAAILATELDLPIVPVAIDGLHKVWARRSMKIRPGKVKVRFGKAFYAKDILSASPAVAGGDSTPHPYEGAATAALGAGSGSPQLTGDSRYQLVTAHLKETIASMIAEMRNTNRSV
jgi:long-chain acyl-CoA synthetase